ncbi:thiamine-phosphate kinase [Candidatus Hydrogenosomobacter endosymbioticus]|uniref:Thiamine-monophosphate kinase n=1 Tax=Candidatus Hydrogenosomobacter endosymbioticus TaxID=2558174 RepID=A0ABN6L2W0_9PROT|nr:thiamine-phosphate kinase [Candidatus Hydrogenosomobacter endosymbioticus]BDB96246.1 thiamine-monophosphate kinase [Candidatus Hydrogenosomobacter endosymbioticus]
MRISEDLVINSIRKNFPLYIGDDSAVFGGGAGEKMLISTDSLVEGVHFRLRYHSPGSLARKALHQSMSDIAAMGGCPRFLLLSACIPLDFHAEYMDKFITSLCFECEKAGVYIIGGNTTKSYGGLNINSTVIGARGDSVTVRRSGASVGDVLCFVGNAGFAHVGFLALEQNKTSEIFDKFKNTFLWPKALVDEGQFLAGVATAMMDVSDGIFIDAGKMCNESGVGAIIDVRSLLCDLAFQEACDFLCINSEFACVEGGEDYGLLFSVPKALIKQASKNFDKAFGYCFREIGTIKKELGVKIVNNGQDITKFIHPFNHF